MDPFQKYGFKSAPDPDAMMEAENTFVVGRGSNVGSANPLEDTGPANVARLVEPVMKSCSLPCPSAIMMLLLEAVTSLEPV